MAATDGSTRADSTRTAEGLQEGIGKDVPRYRHGSRVPGWDDAADLAKDPSSVPDPATTPVPADLRAEIEEFMSRYPDRRSAAIPSLFAVQRRYGWCTPEGVQQAACVMRLTPGYLMAVATFYDMLETQPVGRNTIYVCTNISCSLHGADDLLARLQEDVGDDPDFNVRGFECLGACDIAPMASVNGMYVGPIADGEAAELVAQLRAGEAPLPAKQLRRRASVDPGAARTSVIPSDPLAAGPSMEGDRGEQPAAQEGAPPPPQPLEPEEDA
jgi:NADH-quinone oxidoreductase subunit E